MDKTKKVSPLLYPFVGAFHMFSWFLTGFVSTIIFIITSIFNIIIYALKGLYHLIVVADLMLILICC